jgi:hypothetical protein
MSDEAEDGEIDEFTQKINTPQGKKNNTEQTQYENQLQQALKSITFTRDFLENLIVRTIFDEVVKGCFVRVAVHSKQQNDYVLA